MQVKIHTFQRHLRFSRLNVEGRSCHNIRARLCLPKVNAMLGWA